MTLSNCDLKKVQIRVGNKYLLDERLGEGSFGQVFRATNQENKSTFAIKLEQRSKYATLVREAKIISDLRDQHGFPSLYDYGKEDKYYYIVISLLGWNLEKLLKYCRYQFSLKTVLMLADQMISRIESLHSKNYIHRDLKPENFTIGKGSYSGDLYLIDFGLTKNFKDSNGKHINLREGKGLVGTARYASINAHEGYELSRRDDLESIGYILVYFLKGKLPWQNLPYTEDKEKKYHQIMESKKSTSLEELCKGLPSQFTTYFNYVKSLEFMEDPDYKYLKKLFRTLFVENGYDFDFNYDWVQASRVQKNPQKPQKNLNFSKMIEEYEEKNNVQWKIQTIAPSPEKKKEAPVYNFESEPITPKNLDYPKIRSVAKEETDRSPTKTKKLNLPVITLAKYAPQNFDQDTDVLKSTQHSMAKNISARSVHTLKESQGDLKPKIDLYDEEIPVENPILPISPCPSREMKEFKEFSPRKRASVFIPTSTLSTERSNGNAFLTPKVFQKGKTRTFAHPADKMIIFPIPTPEVINENTRNTLEDTNSEEGDVEEYKEDNKIDLMMNSKRFFKGNQHQFIFS